MLILAVASQSSVSINAGVTLGTTLAVVCSWQRNRSIRWAILHGILSWLYVIHFALTRTESERKKLDLLHRIGHRRASIPKEDGLSFRDFLESDPLAKHLDSNDQMRRYAEWKHQQAKP